MLKLFVKCFSPAIILFGVFAYWAACRLNAQTPAPGTIFYCDTATGGTLSCRPVVLGASIRIVNGVLEAVTPPAKPARVYGLKLTGSPVSTVSWSGLPAGATNVSLFANGLQQYRDKGDWTFDARSGLVTLVYSDLTYEIRVDFDPA